MTVIHAEEEGGYWTEVSDFPGCFTPGEGRSTRSTAT